MQNIWSKVDLKTLEKVEAQKAKVQSRLKKLFKVINIIMAICTVIFITLICITCACNIITLEKAVYFICSCIGVIISIYFGSFVVVYVCNASTRNAINSIFKKDYNEYYEAEAQYLCTFCSTGRGATMPILHLCKLADGSYCTVSIQENVSFELVKESMPLISMKLYIKHKAPKLKAKRKVKVIAGAYNGKLNTIPAWTMVEAF